ncbi:MAG: hypothetical protein CMF62_02605 [Magnetococcales bacterium]|nr:hypothetical protein [Magnetococcales bacterium]
MVIICKEIIIYILLINQIFLLDSITMDESQFVDESGKFNIKKFNKDFDEFKLNRRLEAREKEKSKLAELAKKPEEKPFYKYSIGETFIATKDVWFELLDDLLQGKYNAETFTQGYRPYFIGLTLVVIGIIIILYQYLFNLDEKKQITPKIKLSLDME